MLVALFMRGLSTFTHSLLFFSGVDDAPVEAVQAVARFDGPRQLAPAQRCVEQRGKPSIPPGVYFRMLLVGYFEGIDSQRGIAWRCADSLEPAGSSWACRWTRRRRTTRRCRSREAAGRRRCTTRCFASC